MGMGSDHVNELGEGATPQQVQVLVLYPGLLPRRGCSRRLSRPVNIQTTFTTVHDGSSRSVAVLRLHRLRHGRRSDGVHPRDHKHGSVGAAVYVQ